MHTESRHSGGARLIERLNLGTVKGVRLGPAFFRRLELFCRLTVLAWAPTVMGSSPPLRQSIAGWATGLWQGLPHADPTCLCGPSWLTL